MIKKFFQSLRRARILSACLAAKERCCQPEDMALWEERMISLEERAGAAYGSGADAQAAREALLWEFLKTVSEAGYPDFPNPWPPGSEEHYRFHPAGLLAQILLDASKRQTPGQDGSSESEQPLQAWSHFAQDCAMLLAALGCPFETPVRLLPPSEASHALGCALLGNTRTAAGFDSIAACKPFAENSPAGALPLFSVLSLRQTLAACAAAQETFRLPEPGASPAALDLNAFRQKRGG